MAIGAEFKHPADDIAQALARANGILTVVSGCYEKSSNQFAIGTTFLAESISAVDSLLSSANLALGRLYQICDLTVIRDLPVAKDTTASNLANDISSEIVGSEQLAMVVETKDDAPSVISVFTRGGTEAKSPKVGYLAAFGPSDPVSSLTERMETAVPGFKSSTPSKRETLLEQPATTYEELLAKVTAVADQAAFQAHNSPAERSLLPALEGLRADLMKMRSVA